MAARPLRFLDSDRSSISALVDSVTSESRLALDTESDPFHRYFEKVCLIQISTADEDFVLDPLALGLPAELRSLLGDPQKTWVLHGADYDVRCLRRSFDLVLGRIFDTLIAALLLGEKALGLKPLLETKLGVAISKSEQRSDWGKRPLRPDQLEYARQDTMHLLPLASELGRALEASGRLPWLEEECEILRTVSASPRVFDPEGWRKLKGSKELGPAGKLALRGAYLFREQEAMAKDKPPFRILRTEAMVALALRIERDGLMSPRTLRSERWFPRSADPARLLDAVQTSLGVKTASQGGGPLGLALADSPDGERRYVPHDPETRRRFERLRSARLDWAKALGVDPGFLISSGVLERLSCEPPAELAELRAVKGMTSWRVGVLGDQILSVLRA